MGCILAIPPRPYVEAKNKMAPGVVRVIDMAAGLHAHPWMARLEPNDASVLAASF